MKRLDCSTTYRIALAAVMLFMTGCKSTSWWSDLESDNSISQVRSPMGGPVAPLSNLQMQEILGQVDMLSLQDPAAAARLSAELNQSDPTVWPSVMQSFQTGLAFSNQMQSDRMIANRATPPPNPTLATATTAADSGPFQAAVIPKFGQKAIEPQKPLDRLPAVDQRLLPIGPNQKLSPDEFNRGAVAHPRLSYPDPVPVQAAVSPINSNSKLSNSLAQVAFEAPLPNRIDIAANHNDQKKNQKLSPCQTPLETLKQIKENGFKSPGVTNTKQVDKDNPSLTIENLTFCRAVDGFGLIRPLEKKVFLPGDPMLVYAEIDRFSSQVIGGQYCTSLQVGYQIVDTDNCTVVKQEPVKLFDKCQSRRNDFYLNRIFYLPKKIEAGNYRLCLSVKDMHANTVGQDSIAFVVRTSN
jgi:hypothetical protein